MVVIPERLAATCHATPERRAWLEQLPDAIREVQDRWSLVLGAPFDGSEVSCSWVAPAVRHDGTRAILKLGMPHMEAEHEIHALRFWAGDPTVRLLEADDALNAMLLERCSLCSWWIIPAFWRQAKLFCRDLAQNASYHAGLQPCLLGADSRFFALGSHRRHLCERKYN